MERHNPLDMVDIIIQKNSQIVLIRRKNEPFKDKLAYPGGFVDEKETVEQTAVREAEEETGLKVKLLEILGVYSIPERDPRGPSISTVFVAEPAGGELKGASDVREAKWFKLGEINPDELSFDHKKIFQDYLKWRKDKGTYWSTK